MADDGNKIDVRGDELQTRSFLYVDEYLEGTIRLLWSGFERPVNIGSDEMVTINGIAHMVAEIAEADVGVNNIPGPRGVRGRNSHNRVIREMLGWAPEQTLRQGMEITKAWIAHQVKRKHNKKGC